MIYVVIPAAAVLLTLAFFVARSWKKPAAGTPPAALAHATAEPTPGEASEGPVPMPAEPLTEEISTEPASVPVALPAEEAPADSASSAAEPPIVETSTESTSSYAELPMGEVCANPSPLNFTISCSLCCGQVRRVSREEYARHIQARTPAYCECCSIGVEAHNQALRDNERAAPEPGFTEPEPQ